MSRMMMVMMMMMLMMMLMMTVMMMMLMMMMMMMMMMTMMMTTTFRDILKSSDPMEAMRLGTTKGKMRHFSMFRNSLPG